MQEPFDNSKVLWVVNVLRIGIARAAAVWMPTGFARALGKVLVAQRIAETAQWKFPHGQKF